MKKLILGDCLDVMPMMPADSIDTVITDPPYLLNFMGSEWDKGGSDIPTREVAFRSWFAGFIAGESYFRIQRQKQGGYYSCMFGVHMRADEGPLLRALAKRTNAGHVSDEAAVTGGAVNSARSVRWEVESRDDCWKIARLLDKVPLFGKKQREFDLWRQALQVWTDSPRGNRWHGPADHSEMERLWNQMKELRPFDEELAESKFDPFGQPSYLFHYKWAKAALRVAKPGAMLLAFGGTRTSHRLTLAIEDAGWEIRDCLMWLYGSGMPKSLDIAKAIEKSDGDGRQWEGWGTALKPAWEPIILAMKPLDCTFAENAINRGVAGLNIDRCRISTNGEVVHTPQSDPANRQGVVGRDLGISNSDAEKFKAAQRASIARTNELGRWPANLLLDEESAVLLDEQTGRLTSGTGAKKKATGAGYQANAYAKESRPVGTPNIEYGDSGGASRFFYCSKAPKSEKGKFNNHPTCKPLKLMEYLCRLTDTPTGGTVLDPFMGSGTTGVAASNVGRDFIGIEKDGHYYEIALKRFEAANE